MRNHQEHLKTFFVKVSPIFIFKHVKGKHIKISERDLKTGGRLKKTTTGRRVIAQMNDYNCVTSFNQRISENSKIFSKILILCTFF